MRICWVGEWRKEGTFIHYWWEGTAVMEINTEFPQKDYKWSYRLVQLFHSIPYHIYLKQLISAHCKNIFMPILYQRAKMWNQPRFPSTDKWIKIMWTEYYLAIWKNGILSFAEKYVDLEIIMLSETVQTLKCFACLFLILKSVKLNIKQNKADQKQNVCFP